jgi:hypothetical protein
MVEEHGDDRERPQPVKAGHVGQPHTPLVGVAAGGRSCDAPHRYPAARRGTSPRQIP